MGVVMDMDTAYSLLLMDRQKADISQFTQATHSAWLSSTGTSRSSIPFRCQPQNESFGFDVGQSCERY